MTPNQARLIRFHLGFTGWQTYGPQSRAAAVTLADWGILERGGDNGRQFRLALSDDARRALDAAPAMLAALRACRAEMEMLRRQYQAEDKGAEWIERQAYLVESCDSAIAAATGER